MSAKQIMGFLIASVAFLAVSLLVTFVVIVPQLQIKNPAQIVCYAFNFNTNNDSKIISVGGKSRLKMAKAVRFSPNQKAEWCEDFMSFKGTTIEQGVEFRDTKVGEYVCAIPFSINNSFDNQINFKISIDGCDENKIEYKIFDFADQTYKTLSQLNGDTADCRYVKNGTQFNQLNSGETGNYCFVAVAKVDDVSANILLSVSC